MNRLFLIDCDGVLYPKENITKQDFLNAINHVFSEYGISKNVLKECSIAANAKKYRSLYNYVFTVAQACNISYDEMTRKIVNATDYSHIQPNPKLLDALTRLQEKNHLCIYTNNTNYHVDAVFRKLFCEQTPGELGMTVFHIGTLRRGEVLCPKYACESFWLLEKAFVMDIKEMYLLDDTPEIIRAFPGKQVLITPERSLEQVAHFFSRDKVSIDAPKIQRFEATLFDRKKAIKSTFSDMLCYYRS